MDQRLIVTASFVAHLVAGAVFAGGYLAADVAFTEGQGAFIAGVGYGGPLLALVLIWFRNYVFGAALFVVSLLATVWFVSYFFFLHDNQATVFAVTGDASSAYTMGVVGLVVVSLVAALVGSWLWYHESPGFRTVLHGFLGSGRRDGS